MAQFPDPPDLMTAGEVAKMFLVTDETVHRWARQGILPFIPLPSGTKRFERAVMEQLRTSAFAGAGGRPGS